MKKKTKAEATSNKFDKIINKYQGDASKLIQALLDIQSENGWLPREALNKVSEKLDVPLSRVVHAATFFKAFSTVPEGRHVVHVCDGTTCHVRGSSRVLNAVQGLTGTRPGETDPDFRFSLEAVTCLGCCSSGPVMAVDGKHHVMMDPTKAEDILKNCD